MLGRVDAINRTTRRIMAGDLSQRIALKGSRDEFDQLAANLNAMLDQIERLLRRHAPGDRQHRPRSAHPAQPAALADRGGADAASPGRAESRALLEATLADAETMIGTFNALLDIARAEAGSERSGFETIDLAALGRDLADLYRPLAEDHQLAFELALPARAARSRPITICSRRRWPICSTTRSSTRRPAVGCASRSSAGARGPVITVADSGPGVPDSRPRAGAGALRAARRHPLDARATASASAWSTRSPGCMARPSRSPTTGPASRSAWRSSPHPPRRHRGRRLVRLASSASSEREERRTARSSRRSARQTSDTVAPRSAPSTSSGRNRSSGTSSCANTTACRTASREPRPRRPAASSPRPAPRAPAHDTDFRARLAQDQQRAAQSLSRSMIGPLPRSRRPIDKSSGHPTDRSALEHQSLERSDEPGSSRLAFRDLPSQLVEQPARPQPDVRDGLGTHLQRDPTPLERGQEIDF